MHGTLIVGLNYAPELTGIAPYTSGLAESLAAAGDRVRVVAGSPHYPEWRIQEEYRGHRVDELRGGVAVTHLPHLVPDRRSELVRILMELDFGLRAAMRPWRRPDTVVLVSPALLSTGIGVLRARLSGARVCVWVQDIYSLGLVQTGARGERLAPILRRLERKILSSADLVVVIHDRFRRHLEEDLGVSAPIEVVRNWTHVSPRKKNRRRKTRRRLGWDDDDVIVLHAGNQGAKQGLENVVHAATLAQERGSRVRFILLGDGNRRADLESVNRSDRLVFVDPVPDNEFMDVLSAADILLVNELPGLTEMCVPSKLTSYFATGLPVVAATDTGSVTAEEIASSKGGIRVDAASPSLLLDALELLAEDRDLATALGAAGREYQETMLSAEAATSRFRQLLRGMLPADSLRSDLSTPSRHAGAKLLED